MRIQPIVLEIELSKASLPTAAVHCGWVRCLWWAAWAVQRLMPEGAYCSVFCCSVPTTPPPFNLPFFPWHSSHDRKEGGEKKVRYACICQHLFLQDVLNLSYFWLVYSAAREDPDNNVFVHQNQAWDMAMSTCRRIHIPVIIPNLPPCVFRMTTWTVWVGNESFFGIALSQNRSVILYHLPSRKLTHDLWSEMWFYCQTQLVVPRKVLRKCEKNGIS